MVEYDARYDPYDKSHDGSKDGQGLEWGDISKLGFLGVRRLEMMLSWRETFLE